MAAPALRNTIYSEFSDRAIDEEDEFDAPEFLTGERICPPRPRRSGLFKLLSWLVMLGALGGGWMLMKDRPAWLQTVSSNVAALWSALNPRDAQPVQQETASQAAPSAPNQPPPAATEIAAAPGADAGTAVATVTTEATPIESTEANTKSDTVATDETSVKPAPQPPSPRRTDRYEKQAEAVGLNPDLSKSLLKRLTDTDFRNAGIAIKTALAQTSEADVFTWPAKSKPSLALFEVRFVPGAAENCRRYVVTVTKDRWSTTAPPMEKCGLNSPASAANKS